MARRRWPFACAVALVVVALVAMVGQAVADEIVSCRQLNDARYTIGVNQGSIQETYVRNELPEAEVRDYNDNQLGYTSVSQGKVDAYAYDLTQMKIAIREGDITGVRLLDDTLDETVRICVGVSPRSRIDGIQAACNDFIAEIRSEGVLDDMYERWVIEGDRAMPDVPTHPEAQETLTVVTQGGVYPYSYYAAGGLCGYDIELAYRFADWLGMRVDFVVSDWDGIYASLQAGRADVAMSNIQYVPEAEEIIDFSDPLFEERVGIMVRDVAADSAATDSGVLSWLFASFDRTFLRDERWLLFVSGTGVTLLITLASTVLGTGLGILWNTVAESGARIATRLVRAVRWLVEGMPVVVLLLILYYIVFRDLPVPAMLVAVVAFTLVCAASVLGMVRLGVDAVDKGEVEAALALGYTGRETMWRVVLPQAVAHVLPAFQSEVIALLKSSAVVGYIAVQDLTKAGDIVRGRTYDAIFPLLAVATIYFVLEGLINAAMRLLRRRLDPKRRSAATVLKGVDEDDLD